MTGEELRVFRHRLGGLTQEQFALWLNDRLGKRIDNARISKWESGGERIPKEIAAFIASQQLPARILAFTNQKGGVGKTTTAINIAASLAQSGRRVLLVDADPQASASESLGVPLVDLYRERRTLPHVLLDAAPVDDALIPVGNFTLLPSHIDLAKADGVREPGTEMLLRECLAPLRQRFDHIIIDGPPNLGMMTLMTLTAADEVFVPVRTEPMDTMGLALMQDTIAKVQRRLNPGLRLAGILPTQFRRRKSVDKQILDLLIASLGATVPVLAPIDDNSAFGKANLNYKPAVELYPDAAGVATYRELAAAIAAGTSLPLAQASTVTGG
jgi:chromosome partitioning protein